MFGRREYELKSSMVGTKSIISLSIFTLVLCSFLVDYFAKVWGVEITQMASVVLNSGLP